MSLTKVKESIIPVFCAYEVHDEYGNRKTLLSIHRNKADAEFAAKNQGWWGGPGDVQMKHAIEDSLDLYLLNGFKSYCFADVSEQRAADKKAKLEAALVKLTPEEIALIKGDV